MPKPRKAGPAIATGTTSESLESKKRKRDDPVVAETQTASSPSPRKSKRTKAIDDLAKSPAVSTKSSPGRRKAVALKVEEDLTTEVTVETNGTLTVAEEAQVKIEETPQTTKRTGGRKAKKVIAADLEDDAEEPAPEEEPAKSKRKRKAKEKKEEEGDESAVDEEPKKPKRKRKTKEEKEAEAMPLAARTVGSKLYVGAHTSIAKGVENAVTNCVHIGGNAFACFLKSQRKWENPPLQDANRDAFRKALIEHKYDGMSHIVPHGSYLVNLATKDKDKAQQSYDAFIDDLHRCEALGIRYYNFHPGGAGQEPFGEAVSRLAKNLNRALSETKTVVPLLENMAGHGTLIGGQFSDLRDVIAEIKPELKSRIGVCIDTCHAFAAGYDLRTPEAFQKTMKEFDDIVGIKYLKAVHLNDSKAPFNSHRDLHQNIGLGFLGLRAFHNIMNDSRFHGLPLILETPSERPDPDDPTGKKTIDDKTVWTTEIKLLESLLAMDPAGEAFTTLERELSEKGRKEREEMQAAFERKIEEQKKKKEREEKKLAKEKEKGQQSLKDMFGKQNVKCGKKSKKEKGDDSDKESVLSEVSDLSPLSELSEDERS
ncbi:AP endonuclease 1 [Exophiala viscosa]|uniref:Apurinic-apyrimidinic endonuclease 1 n=1 Tax=Exophiala viscosa TaxID=2486360 RepID=A0AAN6DNW1_9EURO|nr:AP endonuclease 1 [Exophiala viscosa]KAI1625088.1 AP endonuclease 1 [Exophiala viscosa]